MVCIISLRGSPPALGHHQGLFRLQTLHWSRYWYIYIMTLTRPGAVRNTDCASDNISTGVRKVIKAAGRQAGFMKLTRGVKQSLKTRGTDSPLN